MASSFDDLESAVGEHEDRLASLEEGSDQMASDVQQQIDDINTQAAADEENIGQLQFPLSQDTIDLIGEVITNFFSVPFNAAMSALMVALFQTQLPRGQATLSSGTITVNDASVAVASIILVSYASRSGSTGILYLSGQIAGQFVINSRKTDDSGINTSDNSTVNYLVLN